jgi:hypothetical protein
MSILLPCRGAIIPAAWSSLGPTVRAAPLVVMATEASWQAAVWQGADGGSSAAALGKGKQTHVILDDDEV